jgi:hypothetical protein
MPVPVMVLAASDYCTLRFMCILWFYGFAPQIRTEMNESTHGEQQTIK